MKRQVLETLTKISVLTVMAMLTTVGSAQGQSLTSKVRANIPFDFIVADKKLPAGEYIIGRTSFGDSLLLINRVGARSRSIHLTSATQTSVAKAEGTLVFHRYGDQYFLKQVWPAGANTGRALFKSRGEEAIERKARDLKRTMAMKAETAAVVTIKAGVQ